MHYVPLMRQCEEGGLLSSRQPQAAIMLRVEVPEEGEAVMASGACQLASQQHFYGGTLLVQSAHTHTEQSAQKAGSNRRQSARAESSSWPTRARP